MLGIIKEEEEEEAKAVTKFVKRPEKGEEEEQEEDSLFVPPKKDYLYLVFRHGKNDHKQTFFSTSQRTCYVKRVPQMRSMDCTASGSNGWLVMAGYGIKDDRCCLFNTVSMETIELPPMTSYIYRACVLTSSPPDCLVMFVSSKDVSCLFCRPGEQGWTRKVFGPKEEEDTFNVFSKPVAAVSCKDKIYINFNDGKGIAVMDTRTNSFTLIEMENWPSASSICSSMQTSHLLESCGEVFMVLKCYWGTISVFYTLDVFKLNSSCTNWQKVESIGDDRTFFLGETSSLSLSASKTGFKANYIIFFEEEDGCLYSYNMRNEHLQLTLPCPNLLHPRFEPFLMLPMEL